MIVRPTIRRGPRRIVCLTEEPTEILYALGEGHRVVGISAYTVRPPEAKRDKPVVSAFIGGSVPKIAALEPDLVIGFSDIQAKLASELISAQLPVLIFNQRSLQEIFDVVLDIGRLVDAGPRAEALAVGYLRGLEEAGERAARRHTRPRVYFEEWDDPTICGIQWVSELVEWVGGTDIFAERASGKAAKERFVTTEEIVAADPEIMLASWCGKPFDPAFVDARPALGGITAVRDGRVHEIPSEIILQPGPAALTDGLATLERLIGGAA
jgi:iron complex transport system substrate-binding protein